MFSVYLANWLGSLTGVDRVPEIFVVEIVSLVGATVSNDVGANVFGAATFIGDILGGWKLKFTFGVLFTLDAGIAESNAILSIVLFPLILVVFDGKLAFVTGGVVVVRIGIRWR